MPRRLRLRLRFYFRAFSSAMAAATADATPGLPRPRHAVRGCGAPPVDVRARQDDRRQRRLHSVAGAGPGQKRLLQAALILISTAKAWGSFKSASRTSSTTSPLEGFSTSWRSTGVTGRCSVFAPPIALDRPRRPCRRFFCPAEDEEAQQPTGPAAVPAAVPPCPTTKPASHTLLLHR